MKAKAKRARKARKTFRKAFFLLLVAAAAYFAVVWMRPYYPKIEQYLNRFGIGRIDTSEVDAYYDLLSGHAQSGKDLVLNPGVKDKDNLQDAVDRLQGVMGLKEHKIWLAHHDAEKPPAYIKQLGYGDMGILISTKVTERREEINLLVHELGHIYVWRLEPSVFGKCDQEKLVDCSGVFLGLGILMLNGLTDELNLLPGQGYETRKKLFGYLKAEQFGYLVARYCAEHGIPADAVMPFLNTAGRKYFDIGREYLKKSGRVASASAGRVTGAYWCPKCGSFTRIPLSGKIGTVVCPACKG